MARWSIQTMTFRSGSPELLIVSGWPAASTTTSEQVASKPTPLTAEAGSAASAMAARAAVAQAAQISAEDCSATLPASCHTVIGCRAVASRVPFSSKSPARALDVPTSMPTKACCISTPLQISASSPARITSVNEDNTSGHQTGGIGRQEQDDGRYLVDLPHPRHRRTADPGIIHLRAVFDECVEGGCGVSRRHGVDTDAARAPLGGERFGQMVHRSLRGVVVTLLLRLVDDEARHRTDVHDGTGLCAEHVLAEGAAAPERAVEIDVDDVQPMLVGDLLGRCLAAGDAGIVDQDLVCRLLLE